MGPPTRRTELQRQQRRDSRTRILEAASGLLEERRWHELRLEDVMGAAGLSRTAFYRHFDDRDAMLLAMLDEVREHIGAAGPDWKNGVGDQAVALRTGLVELTEAMRQYGRLMQAIADSATYDAGMRSAREELVQGFTDVTAARIRAEVAAGRSGVGAPQDVAEALVRMSESHLLAAFGHPPYPETSDVAATIYEIWASTIYGREVLEAVPPHEAQRYGAQRST